MSRSTCPKRGLRSFGLAVAVIALLPAQSMAIPILQLYVEGGTYDSTTETWTISTDGGPFKLWTIGNIAAPCGKGPIYDVKLAAAYSSAAEAPTITLTPSTVTYEHGLYFGGFSDPSVPDSDTTTSGIQAPSLTRTVTNGSLPVLGDGSFLAAHDIYGTGTSWQEFSLGDFTLTDSPIADFITTFPSAPATPQGQINVYEVAITSPTPISVHFDLYNHVAGNGHAKYKFAPFSHDAEGAVAPEPASLTVWLLLGLAACGLGWRRRFAH
ncbi:MAG: choice-of-anchor N protein [Pirellulales bacterium]